MLVTMQGWQCQNLFRNVVRELICVNVAVCSDANVKVSNGRPLVEKVDIKKRGFTSAFGRPEKDFQGGIRYAI